uniref:Trans-2,3-enoyl-CoA reductase-like 2a n=1 Tax=Eptatretus burgeri TaxID=7764 RepID=A0A8C4WTA4_EPTBU
MSQKPHESTTGVRYDEGDHDYGHSEMYAIKFTFEVKVIGLDQVSRSNGNLSLFVDPGMYPARQSLRVDPGKRDGDVLQHLPVGTTAIFYLYDLGPQVNWSTALLCRYTLSLALYYLCYTRPPFIYGSEQAFSASPHRPVHLACVCYTFHYAKCILETVYIHNVSRGTFPLRQAVRTCACYGAFTLWMAFYVNHPLYTPPCVGLFVRCCIRLNQMFRLMSAGHKEMIFPVAGPNPFTWPFAFISCPNYTYEVKPQIHKQNEKLFNKADALHCKDMQKDIWKVPVSYVEKFSAC